MGKIRPTPWEARPPRAGRGWVIYAADGREVCEVDSNVEDDGESDARCIVESVNAVQTPK